MENVKQTVTRTEDSGIDSSGAAVERQTKQIDTESTADSNTIAQNIVWYILGLIEVLLGLRFIFKLLGANSSSGFVSFIYSVTGVLTAPFDSIFGVSSTNTGSTHSVFEPSILVAAAVYALIAWGIVKLMNVTHKQ